MTGLHPNFFIDRNDVIRGSDINVIRTLSEKMHFQYSINTGSSYDGLVNKVGYNYSFSL